MKVPASQQPAWFFFFFRKHTIERVTPVLKTLTAFHWLRIKSQLCVACKTLCHPALPRSLTSTQATCLVARSILGSPVPFSPSKVLGYLLPSAWNIFSPHPIHPSPLGWNVSSKKTSLTAPSEVESWKNSDDTFQMMRLSPCFLYLFCQNVLCS